MLPEKIKTDRLALRPFSLEDAEAVFEYASPQDWGRYQQIPFPTPGSSARVLLKLGFTHEGTLRSNQFQKGEFVDDAVYGLLREEWNG